MKKILAITFLIGIILGVGFLFLTKKEVIKPEKLNIAYLGSLEIKVKAYDEKYKEVNEFYRGTKVELYDQTIIGEITKQEYKKVKIEGSTFLFKSENIVDTYNKVIYEEELFVRTNTTVYKEDKSSEILGLIKKGEPVKIIGFNTLENGFAPKYKIMYNGSEGFVYSKYLVSTKEEAMKNYDENNSYQVHLKRTNTQGGGDAGSLDFYPYEKAKFEENKMPEKVRSLYLNAGVIKDVDKYIEIAKNTNINAFVVDIKDNTAPAYKSKVMEKYSKTNFNHAINSFDDYKNAIQKLKENGFYVIGRITVFKDSYYVTDHPEAAIADSAGNPYKHNGSYWPSAYNRDVWEFNVELAKEAVVEMGFHEIQFDYVRFPDRTYALEKNGEMNLKNTYNETKAQAIQTFLMYACDQIHEVRAYVSADVFGESAHNYVTGYGQYWGAISNVVDVISAMPYPDHFGAYEYGIKDIVWTVPYKLLYAWGNGYANVRQQEIPTPAVVRTWIQAYNTVREPYIVYDSTKIKEQIDALEDAGLTGGFMTWNAASSLSKYNEIAPAFEKE
ncbi:MAG: hypothetical protein HFH09_02715 [Bacilli bacterium]|nr:hypothetical protein [Bacilli bacterium]